MYLFWLYYIIGNYNIMFNFIKNIIYYFFYNLNNTVRLSLKNNHDVDILTDKEKDFDHRFFVNIRF